MSAEAPRFCANCGRKLQLKPHGGYEWMECPRWGWAGWWSGNYDNHSRISITAAQAREIRPAPEKPRYDVFSGERK